MKVRKARSIKPLVVGLEARRVPTTAMLDGSTLRIVGSDQADQIVVQSSWLGRARPRGPEVLSVVGVGRFLASQVRQIVVDAGAGDDMVTLNLRRGGLAPVVDGGAGDDLIRGRIGADIIYGGAGDDVILGRGGVDQIDPGAGRNLVNGQWMIVADPAPPSAPAPQASPPPSNPTANPPTWVLAPTDPLPTIDVAAWVNRIYDLTNAERVKAGLNTLSINPKLVQIAQLQANQMVRYGKMQHEIPEAPYPDMRSRADAIGYKLEWLGENLAYNYGDPDSVVQGWMMSTGHRDNMLFAPFTEMGVAIGLDPNGRPYIALELGRPAS